MQFNKDKAKTSIALISFLLIGFISGMNYDETVVEHQLTYNDKEGTGILHEHHAFNPDRQVTYTGTLQVGNYTVHFDTEANNDNLKGSTAGYTYAGGKKEIWIETNKTAAQIESICDHEVFHERFPKFEHPEGKAKYTDPVYMYSDQAYIWQCDLATYAALQNQ